MAPDPPPKIWNKFSFGVPSPQGRDNVDYVDDDVDDGDVDDGDDDDNDDVVDDVDDVDVDDDDDDVHDVDDDDEDDVVTYRTRSDNKVRRWQRIIFGLK